jgi:transcriptional regulator with XRE-family HTH domain
MRKQPNRDQIRAAVGHRVRVRRVEMKMSQGDLARAVNTRQAAVSEWELGKRTLRVDELVNVALVLRTSVAYLVGEAERVPLSLQDVEQRELFAAA